MKRVLISGKGSYIGTSVKVYLENKNSNIEVVELDVKGDSWKSENFSKYDVVFHVAGIAHIKETKENKELYQKVNCDLAYDVARKAKEDGVAQFIFMSSMSVYGMSFYDGYIDEKTDTNPNTFYGMSKLNAEHRISELVDSTFNVAYLRPPMVVGPKSPGNMGKLIHAVDKIHIFPKFKNERSYITIETLAMQIDNIIKMKLSGILLLQEEEYLCTSDYIARDMKEKNKWLLQPRLFNPIIRFARKRIGLFAKVFGDLKYRQIDYFKG